MPLMHFRKMRKNMGRKETILPGAKIDGRKYLEDKPKSCDYCYWWQGKNKGCILPECYYLMPEEKKEPNDYEEGNCRTCPYGKHGCYMLIMPGKVMSRAEQSICIQTAPARS